MARTILITRVRSAFQISTTLRSELSSASVNQYVPGERTKPGTSTGSLKVTLVALFDSSAITAFGSIIIIITNTQNATPDHLLTIAYSLRIKLFLLYLESSHTVPRRSR